MFFFFFSSRRRHTRYIGDWSSDVCSSDLVMITIKTSDEIEILKEGGKRHFFILSEVGKIVKAGISTQDLENLARSEERRVGKERRGKREGGRVREKRWKDEQGERHT